MKIKSYLKETLARITGDKDEVIAQRNYRKASASIKGQLAALESKLVNDEEAVQEANEALNKAMYPTELITDQQEYASNLAYHNESVQDAQDQLETTKASIEFYKKVLVDFEEEVEA